MQCKRVCRWMEAFVYPSHVQSHWFWSTAIVVIYCAVLWHAHILPWWEGLRGVRRECERVCLPSERGAQSRLLLTQGDSKCEWMNTNDRRDEEERLKGGWGEDRKIRVAGEIAHGCKHGGLKCAGRLRLMCFSIFSLYVGTKVICKGGGGSKHSRGFDDVLQIQFSGWFYDGRAHS